MKIRFLILSVLMLTSVAIAAPKAQAATAEDIAIVDMQTLMRESEAGKSIQKQVTTIREEFKKTISAKEKDLRAGEKELVNKKASLSAEDFNIEKEKFEKNLIAVQKDVLSKQKELDKSFGEAMDTLRNEAVKIIAEKAKEKKASIVLPRQNIIIVDQTLDLTQDVLTELNAKMKTVSVKTK